jgi:aerobic-type carbon monoxide dehydrogenase small subunit (CoxS/CutS family)
MDLRFNINGEEVTVRAAADETLLSVLRNRLHLTGTKCLCASCGMAVVADTSD